MMTNDYSGYFGTYTPQINNDEEDIVPKVKNLEDNDNNSIHNILNRALDFYHLYYDNSEEIIDNNEVNQNNLQIKSNPLLNSSNKTSTNSSSNSAINTANSKIPVNASVVQKAIAASKIGTFKTGKGAILSLGNGNYKGKCTAGPATFYEAGKVNTRGCYWPDPKTATSCNLAKAGFVKVWNGSSDDAKNKKYKDILKDGDLMVQFGHHKGGGASSHAAFWNGEQWVSDTYQGDKAWVEGKGRCGNESAQIWRYVGKNNVSKAEKGTKLENNSKVMEIVIEKELKKEDPIGCLLCQIMNSLGLRHHALKETKPEILPEILGGNAEIIIKIGGPEKAYEEDGFESMLKDILPMISLTKEYTEKDIEEKRKSKDKQPESIKKILSLMNNGNILKALKGMLVFKKGGALPSNDDDDNSNTSNAEEDHKRLIINDYFKRKGIKWGSPQANDYLKKLIDSNRNRGWLELTDPSRNPFDAHGNRLVIYENDIEGPHINPNFDWTNNDMLNNEMFDRDEYLDYLRDLGLSEEDLQYYKNGGNLSNSILMREAISGDIITIPKGLNKNQISGKEPIKTTKGSVYLINKKVYYAKNIDPHIKKNAEGGLIEEISTVKCSIGNNDYTLFEAKTEEAREKGLMGVTDLKDDEGMIFYYDKPLKVSFWMKDTEIPLDICFFNEDYECISIKSGHPLSEEPIEEKNVQYVVEIPAGSDIQPGDELDLPGDEDDYVMHVLGSDGLILYSLKGGERIVSRRETKILIKKAKRAYNAKGDDSYDAKCRSLGKYIFKVLDGQDGRDAEYVQLDTKE